jgi:hypothetical protein
MKTSTFLGLNVLICAIAVIVVMHFWGIRKNTHLNLARKPSTSAQFANRRSRIHWNDAPASLPRSGDQVALSDAEMPIVAPETTEVPGVYLAFLAPIKPTTDTDVDLTAQISALIDQNREEQLGQQRAIAAHSVAHQY